MNIKDSIVVVTGANRGIGLEFTRQLLERGAAKVYAGARNPDAITAPGVEALALDVTDPQAVLRAAEVARDATIVINNAGISTGATLLGSPLADVRKEFEVNLFGLLDVTRAFAPILGSNGGGAIINVLSRLSWVSFLGTGGYDASKAAAWSATNGIRLELASQGTQVTGLHLSATDTDMTADWEMEKNDPADVVRQALDGLEAGALEVIADADTAETKRQLALDPSEVYGEQLELVSAS